MTTNQCAPGCGLRWPGEGAVARRSIGKIDNIRCGGGGVGSPSFFDRAVLIKQSARSQFRFIRGFWSNFSAGVLTLSLTRWHATTYPPPAYAYRRQRGHASCARYSARPSFHRRHRAGWCDALWVGLEVRCEMEVRWAHKPRSSTKNKQK